MEQAWNPIRPGVVAETELSAYQESIAANGAGLDRGSCAEVVDGAAAMVIDSIEDLRSDDSLPFLSHLCLGFGDLPAVRQHLVPRFFDFVQTHEGPGFVAQRDSEGDFHPWQSFAYLSLLRRQIPDCGRSIDADRLRDAAVHSRDLNVDRGEELGHGLLAAALLFSRPAELEFVFAGRAHTFEELLREALHAQWFGDFDVCRKFHLTEGIYAAAFQNPGLSRYRELAAAALDGQEGVLRLVAVLLRAIVEAGRTGSSDTGLVTRIRSAAGIGPFFADHLFYAGHLLELDNVVALHGGRRMDRGPVVSMINDMNRLLAPRLQTPREIITYAVQISHYRRALMTFLTDEPPSTSSGTCRPPQRQDGVASFFVREPPDARHAMRPEFEAALSACRSAVPDLPFRGTFGHFRRAHRAYWPRTLHYELLDYGDWIGAEIHLEGGSAMWARPHLSALAARWGGWPAPGILDWDGQWWNGRGRLRVVFPPGSSPETIARAMAALVDATGPDVLGGGAEGC